MGGNAGTSGSAGAGGAELMAGNGGSGATSDGGEPPTSAGEGPGGSGGSGGSAGDGGAPPDPIGGSAGDGGAPPDPIGGAGGSAGEGSDLVLHYEFEDGSGTTVADSSESNFDGTIVGGAAFTTGRIGGGLQLTGTNSQHVTFPANVLENCDDLTIALWANLGALPAWARFIEIDGGVNGFMYFTPTGYAGMPTPSAASLQFVITHPDTVVGAPLPTTLVGGWHHFAVTLVADTAQLYIDGIEVANTAFARDPSDIGVNMALPVTHGWIGRSLSPTDPYLNAAIDDLRMSCRGYSADEIAELAQQ
jgi:hypothetical protein